MTFPENCAEWVSAISSFLAVILAGYGLKIAKDQLVGLKDELKIGTEQLKLGIEAAKINSLMAILEIESQINERKQRSEEVSFKIQNNNGSNSNNKEILINELDCALENYINAVDRLAFCIIKEYVKDRDWRTEYRDYISDLIKANPDFFKPGSKYLNIIDLNNKWQRE